MESTLVSARISHAKKDAGAAVLESLGATTSELINAAFDYLIENKSIPSSETSQKRCLEEYELFLNDSTLDIDWGNNSETLDYKQILREGKRADYESLA